MKIHDCIQLSPEWWDLHAGRPTASEFDRVLTPLGKVCAKSTQDNYINELVAGHICPDAAFFSERGTAAMRRGQDYEPQARRYFEHIEPAIPLKLVGFVTTDDGRFGCSPDFMTMSDEPGELKCPLAHTHVEYLRAKELPRKYKPQVHGHLIVTGAACCHFMSFHPAYPTLYVCVVPDEYTERLRAELDKFWDRYQAALADVLAMVPA